MKYAPAFLLAVGLAQMIGDLAGIPALRGIAAATAASPAPKVFSSVSGLETYSSRFTIEWTDEQGREQDLAVTAERYAGVRGPYNRRNVYGAALAYAPVLAADPRTRPAFEQVARYALCDRAPLLRELGVDAGAPRGARRVRIEPRRGLAPVRLPLVFEVSCA
jgi:hypothetical protein